MGSGGAAAVPEAEAGSSPESTLNAVMGTSLAGVLSVKYYCGKATVKWKFFKPLRPRQKLSKIIESKFLNFPKGKKDGSFSFYIYNFHFLIY